eukprot:TRINITY_DN2555_c2_g1_i2.p1 TRINITY_DN2555_c2_g1~~TRINITY_DN2555_c2_g1_i2.p1  ORF type:complete len:492 (-),score=74.27 TRINITY_DN2555_c2_g1_i2:161-1516(-)
MSSRQSESRSEDPFPEIETQTERALTLRNSSHEMIPSVAVDDSQLNLRLPPILISSEASLQTGSRTLGPATTSDSKTTPRQWDWFRQLFVKDKSKENQKHPPIIAPTFDDLPSEALDVIKKSVYKKSDFDSSRAYKDLIAILTFVLRRSVRISEEPRLLPLDPVKRNLIRQTLLQKFQTYEQIAQKMIVHQDPKKHYRITGEIGRGAFGRVFVGKNLADNTKVAIKRLPHLKEVEMRYNLRELGMQILSKHLNVCAIISTHLWKNEFWVVSEFCGIGSLRDLTLTRSLAEDQIAWMVFEITVGLKHIHECVFIHRDIKPENAVLHTDGHTKIIDFGLCVPIEQGEEGKIAGSPSFMSPELLRQERYTEKADIWSLGVSIVEILNEQFPFSPSRNNTTKRVQRDRFSFLYSVAHSGKIPDIYEDDVWDVNLLSFIRRCLTYDHELRPSLNVY